MTVTKNHVTIKGNKDGLLFLLDDQCEYTALLEELRHKLEKTHQKILTGPIIHVHVKLGLRETSDEQKEEIRQLIRSRGNLLVQTITGERPASSQGDERKLKVHKGMVRSGQTLQFEGSLLFIGDVNPGGTLVCTGDIYVMGALKGMAHAGMEGDETAVIAASHLRPTQLRIASVISRPPDEWEWDTDAYMEFAYLDQGKMEIDKLIHMHRIRPGALEFKGE
jgi:septum site-determining protein MinC